MALVIGAGFFSGIETGLISINRIHLQQLLTEKDRRARRIKNLLEHPNRAITMFLIGTNLCIVSATSLATYLSVKHLPIDDKNLCTFIASCIMTPTILILAEIFPKALFRLRAESLMYTLSAPITALYRTFLPVIHVFSLFSKGIIWILRAGKKKNLEDRVDREAVRSREDLRLLIKLSEKEGILEEEEERMIYSVFDFGTMSAREVMTPRVDMVTVEHDASLEQVLDIFIKGGYSRMPIYKEDLDHIVGFINAFDLLMVKEMDKELADFMRKTMFVPETMKVSTLLQGFQREKTHIAVVVDEYGGTSGLVTMEDILEEIVGEIDDEFDKTATRVRILKDGSLMLDGRFSLHDLNQEFGLDLPTGDDVDSIGGFFEHEMGKVPQEGEEFRSGNVIFTVTKSDSKRVIRLRMRFLEKSRGEDEKEERGDLDESERH